MSPNLPLYLAILFYAGATAVVLVSLVARNVSLQRVSLILAGAGFISHTIWIGIICAKTDHPPLTNLPEAAAFIAWTILAVKFVLHFKFRIHAAAFFVYPLVLMLMIISAIVREPFAPLDPALRSNLFTAHLLLTTVGVAGLLIGLAFTIVYSIQERALKSKSRGALYDWIPSLRVCDLVTYRALAIGFVIYTLGILAGILWSYRTTAGLTTIRAKEVGAYVAWILFAALLQSHISGPHKLRRDLVISAAAFISILVAILGIHRV